MPITKQEIKKAIMESQKDPKAKKFGPETSIIGQLRCLFTVPFGHVYDGRFFPRPDKRYAYYEHCAVCGCSRSWIDFKNNYKGSEQLYPGYYTDEKYDG